MVNVIMPPVPVMLLCPATLLQPPLVRLVRA